MTVIKIDKRNVKIVAHRGLSGIEVENTDLAFRLAANRSYYGIETDVHVTRDGKFIICHDDDLNRIAGVDMIIEDSDYDDLKKICLYNIDKSKNIELKLPDLIDYIKICKDSGKISFLELKNKMKKEKIIEIINLLKDNNHFENTMIISFSFDNIISCKEAFPEVNCMILSGIDDDKMKEEVLNFAIKYGVGVDVYFRNITQKFIDDCHKNIVLVNVFTVDDPQDATEMIKMGVDYITSNILE